MLPTSTVKLITRTLIVGLSANCSAVAMAQNTPENINGAAPSAYQPAPATVTKREQPKLAKLDPQVAKDAEEIQVANSKNIRRFHEVLDELLAEFSYDVKMGQINGLENLAIRRVEVSDAIPDTYGNYVELLVSERIRENSRIRIVNCLPCKSKTSRLVEGKLLITSPRTNLAEMSRAAAQLGIDHFMDVVLVYHTTHMVLAFQVFNTKTNETTWARTYNSETIRSRYQKLAVDFSQVARSRDGDEYKPEYRLLVGLGGASIPNVGGDENDSGMLNLQFRGTEKFNNRRSEFGLLLSLYMQTKALMSEFPTTGSANTEEEEPAVDEEDTEITPVPYSMAVGLYAMYAHNFVTSIESYNNIRHALNAGAGAFLAVGFMAPTMRAGWDVYFGRRFVASTSLMYVMPSKILVNSEFVPTNGGIGADVVLSLNY